MIETLRSILERERDSVYLELTNQEFSNEIIQFPKELILDSTCSFLIIKNNNWFGLVVGRTDFYFSQVISSVWVKCFFHNVSFGEMEFVSSRIENCTFYQCKFEDSIISTTHFQQCTFLEGSLAGATFKSCEFIDTKWKLDFITGSVIDCQFTNSKSKKSIKFDEKSYFVDIQHQINNID